MIATAVGIVAQQPLNGFGRPRPQLSTGARSGEWSFPSATPERCVLYGRRHLATRLQVRHLHRVLTLLGAAVLIVAIAVTRLYLGVHYPSDVIAGVIIGLAWAGFCMATLEAIQLYARKRAPKVLKQEVPPPRDKAQASA